MTEGEGGHSDLAIPELVSVFLEAGTKFLTRKLYVFCVFLVFPWMKEIEDNYVSREAWLEIMPHLAEFDGISLWTLGRVAGPVRA